MTVFAVSRHIPSDFTDRDRAQKALALARRFENELGIISSQRGNRVVISSDTKRAIETANVFATVVGAHVVQYSHFNENVRDDRRALEPGIKLLEENLDAGHELVWLVTHQPLVEPFFCRVAGERLKLGSKGNWFSVSELWYGVHAANLETREVVSFGKVGF